MPFFQQSDQSTSRQRTQLQPDTSDKLAAPNTNVVPRDTLSSEPHGTFDNVLELMKQLPKQERFLLAAAAIGRPNLLKQMNDSANLKAIGNLHNERSRIARLSESPSSASPNDPLARSRFASHQTDRNKPNDDHTTAGTTQNLGTQLDEDGDVGMNDTEHRDLNQSHISDKQQRHTQKSQTTKSTDKELIDIPEFSDGDDGDDEDDDKIEQLLLTRSKARPRSRSAETDCVSILDDEAKDMIEISRTVDSLKTRVLEMEAKSSGRKTIAPKSNKGARRGPRPIDENLLKKRIRNYADCLMGVLDPDTNSRYPYPDPPSNPHEPELQDIQEFTMAWLHSIKCAFNVAAVSQFVNAFLWHAKHMAWGYTKDDDGGDIEEAFKVYFRTMAKKYKAQVQPQHPAISLDQRLAQAAIRRKNTLWQSRQAAAAVGDLRKYVPLLNELQSAGMSSDEGENDEDGNWIYRISSKPWRSAELEGALQLLSLIYTYSLIDIGSRGSRVRYRDPNIISARQPVKKLWKNCYSPKWLSAQSDFAIERLCARDEDFDFSISDQIQNIMAGINSTLPSDFVLQKTSPDGDASRKDESGTGKARDD
ncbi:hypothetical protein FRC02_006888 [Tulasnella sp. 418]|nr:hypothetical protein FRC02_006888 [Tulasnella sp. 418]